MQRFLVSRRAPAWLAVLLSATMSLVLPAYAQQPRGQLDRTTSSSTRSEPLFQVRSKRSKLKIVERFTEVIELQTKITRVDGFDPKVVEVTALTPNQIRVQAVAPGITTLVLVDEKDEMYSIEVFVTGDVRHLQAHLNHFFPNASIEAVEVRDSVVLRGWVSQPEHINELVEIAEQFYPRVINQVRVGGVQQVLLKVKVMEVQRSKMRKLGFNFVHLNRDSAVSSTPGQLTPLTTFNTPFGGTPSVSLSGLADPTVALGVMTANSVFQGFIEALKEENLLKIMAEPTIVTTNGRPATLLTGGEFPIPVPQSLGTVTIEWREFGTRLEAVPIILGNGRLRLELAPEVSERDFTHSVDINGINVPALTTRRVNTQVEMNFGQTLVIAGLIANNNTAEVFKIPVLGDLPWVGALFSRKTFEDEETELVIMVTPEFVAPLDPGQVPPGGPGLFTDRPTDREILDGFNEVPKYGDECEGCGATWPKSVVPDGSGRMRGTVPNHSGGISPVPAGAGSGIPRMPPAPASSDLTTSAHGASQGLSRLNPFRRRTDRRIPGDSSIRQTGFSRGVSDAGTEPGLIEPQPGLITP